MKLVSSLKSIWSWSIYNQILSACKILNMELSYEKVIPLKDDIVNRSCILFDCMPWTEAIAVSGTAYNLLI